MFVEDAGLLGDLNFSSMTDVFVPMKESHFVRAVRIDTDHQLRQHANQADYVCICLAWYMLYTPSGFFL